MILISTSNDSNLNTEQPKFEYRTAQISILNYSIFNIKWFCSQYQTTLFPIRAHLHQKRILFIPLYRTE